MEFLFKKEISAFSNEIASLKGKKPFGFLFLNFPKKTLAISDVLIEDAPCIEYKKILPKEVLKRALPKTIELKIHQKFIENQKYVVSERFVLLMKEARVAFNECFVITKKGFLVEELNRLMGRKESPIFHKKRFPKIRAVSGSVCVLFNFDNYFHWMTDVLPRIMLVKDLGIKIDNYVTGADKKFKKESLHAIGIKEKELIMSSDELHLAPKLLVAPSSYANQGNPTKEICSFLRKNFLKKAPASYAKKYEKIYVLRGNSKERKVLNEEEVVKFLSLRGFIAVQMDKKSIKEQAKIFNSAKIIVAAHGAALTNIVFSKKGTKVIEIFHPDYVNVCFWSMSNLLGIDYCYFFGERKKGFDTSLSTNISLEKLTSSLKLMGL